MSTKTKQQRREKRKAKKSTNLSYAEMAQLAKDQAEAKRMRQYERILGKIKTGSMGMY